VGLIEDEDLEAVSRRGEDCALAQVSGVVNTVVAGSIDLNNI
jgi:hypothetical protein